jgi:tetrahydromethanopterin S-methyltransferase subunit G
MMAERRDDRSLGDLFAELARETSTLVRQEVQLARGELSQQATRVGRDIGALLVGGAVVYAGLLAIIAALILLLADLGLDWWLAALLVGVVVGGVGAALVARAVAALKRVDLVPRQTIDTLREDQEWVKEQTS